MTAEQEQILKGAEFSFEEVELREGRALVGPIHVKVNGREFMHLCCCAYDTAEPDGKNNAIERLKEAALKFLARTDFSYDPYKWHNFFEVGADA